jgi:hypothetical protein
MRLSARHELWLYASSAALLISGVGWLVGHYFLASNGLPASSEPWWLRVHGAALIVFLVVFGALMPNHVVLGWRLRRNRRSGVFMFALVVLLTLTGYGLYYSGEDQQRSVFSAIHWLVGLASALALALHVLLGKRSSRK